jgi:hypothetical protein
MRNGECDNKIQKPDCMQNKDPEKDPFHPHPYFFHAYRFIRMGLRGLMQYTASLCFSSGKY